MNFDQTIGKLFLIPCPISPDGNTSISAKVKTTIEATNYFVVERLRTARRFIKSVNKNILIDDLYFYELDKHGQNEGLVAFLHHFKEGFNIGLISEAGNPAIADPGNEVVAWCHQNFVKVVPLAGPSAILLALIASGFNGQNFAFNGYLPRKKDDLAKKLKQLEAKLFGSNQTQLFMETPYRNEVILSACMNAFNSSTKLMVACDLDSKQEEIIVLPVSHWKNIDLKKFHKRPAVFGIGR